MESKQIENIQQALVAQGFSPGPIDGLWGRQTIAALRAFQAKAGLQADGIFGPQTAAKLFATTPDPAEGVLLPWYQEAEHLIGLTEAPGSDNNPTIMSMAKELRLNYRGDDVPWCGLFVAHCVGSTLPDELLPGNPLGARNWDRFGHQTTPRLGAVMVFWRESRDGGKGHVGFYAGECKTHYLILGGNQNNRVCKTWITRDRWLAARWPRTAYALEASARVMAFKYTGEVSGSET